MFTLRITQSGVNSGRHRVIVSLQNEHGEHAAETEFDFHLSQQDRERFRWYLEDYLQFPLAPAPTIAQSIEKRMAEVGSDLFNHIFESNDQGRELWAVSRNRLNDIRIEVATNVLEATTIPWELLRDPTTDVPLALSVSSFVRIPSEMDQASQLYLTSSGSIRVLLVISRPAGKADAPFRSVAARMLKAVVTEGDGSVHLDLLRPATFEHLREVLRQAKIEGRPYHIVHFDGHGIYDDLHARFEGVPPKRMRGYLAFEHPHSLETDEFIHGQLIGTALIEADVPILVMNACRSAHAEPSALPDGAVDPPSHSQPNSLGSLAMEVINAGVPGVVAMRYNVYVVTAAQFMVDLYTALAKGESLGEAVSRGRKQLAEDPLRAIIFAPVSLQDWAVPVVYEATPITLLPKSMKDAMARIEIRNTYPMLERGELDWNLPAQPDPGFFGRDETLLTLDRTFDRQAVVLLHAYAGSGKTATVGEFARWYSLTGGVEGPVLFTSFEYYKALPRVLDQLGQLFKPVLERSGVQWLGLDDTQRRMVALDILNQVPVLWIWDNVEQIAGFPSSTDSPWSSSEQRELAAFLREARGTKARFLLTSRRDEKGWLSDLPGRVKLPRMTMQERMQLVQAMAEKQKRQPGEFEDWRPLLEFTDGNPMTLSAVVSHALREDCRTKIQIEALAERLREGELPFEDEITEGRTKSLGASLNYGFENAFTKTEQKQLALLHLFQSFVDVDALRAMGESDSWWCLPEVDGLTEEDGKALLDTASSIGLLTMMGGGKYRIHPAVPWFFRRIFEQGSSSSSGVNETHHIKSTHAFVIVMGDLGILYDMMYDDGHQEVIGVLLAEEANLLHARRLARRWGWWDRVLAPMKGLRTLYEHTGRTTEWRRLVEEVFSDFTDTRTEEPLPGRESDWFDLLISRATLAIDIRSWEEAEHLLRRGIDWSRARVHSILYVEQATLNDDQCSDIRSLTVALHQLGRLLMESRQPDCSTALEEAWNLARRINDRGLAASCAFNIGGSYINIAEIRNLKHAELWYRRSFDLREAHDRQGRGQCTGQLGRIFKELGDEAKNMRLPKVESQKLYNQALSYYQQALTLIPSDSIFDLGVINLSIGTVLNSLGHLEQAFLHYQKSIQYMETQGDVYGAAKARHGVAACLGNARRFVDAIQYAEEALKEFESCGLSAINEVQEMRKMIRHLNQDFRLQEG